MTNLLALLAGLSWALTPLPTVDQSTRNVSENFLEMAKEIQRRDLTRGGTVRGNLTVTGTLTQAGGAGANLTASQTFTGTNTFNGAAQFNGTTTFKAQASFNGFTSSNTSVFMSSIVVSGLGGDPARANQAIAYKMKSIDGATQSAECVVMVSADGTAATSLLTFTSTTTAQAEGMIGVLLESCAPGAFCNVAVFGPVRLNCDSTITPMQDAPCSSGIRCEADNCTTLTTRGTSGFFLTGPSSNKCVAFLGAK